MSIIFNQIYIYIHTHTHTLWSADKTTCNIVGRLENCHLIPGEEKEMDKHAIQASYISWFSKERKKVFVSSKSLYQSH